MAHPKVTQGFLDGVLETGARGLRVIVLDRPIRPHPGTGNIEGSRRARVMFGMLDPYGERTPERAEATIAMSHPGGFKSPPRHTFYVVAKLTRSCQGESGQLLVRGITSVDGVCKRLVLRPFLERAYGILITLRTGGATPGKLEPTAPVAGGGLLQFRDTVSSSRATPVSDSSGRGRSEKGFHGRLRDDNISEPDNMHCHILFAENGPEVMSFAKKTP